ncbi:hypothetical protein D1007_45736 [Hordeum vulgare]|nr:hypothetical protein D1007_45736 [Hordeum vulgare]
MEEMAMKNVVEKIGESIFWGPEKEVTLLPFDNCKGAYVKTENGEEMVEEIDRQDGWMVDDDWASHRQITSMCMGEETLIEGVDADAQEGCDGAARVIFIDWNSVELEDTIDLVITPMADIETAKHFGIIVDYQDKEERDKLSFPSDANRDAREHVDEQIMKDVVDDVDDAHA